VNEADFQEKIITEVDVLASAANEGRRSFEVSGVVYSAIGLSEWS